MKNAKSNRYQYTPDRIRCNRRGTVVSLDPPAETLLAIHRVYQGVKRIVRRKGER